MAVRQPKAVVSECDIEMKTSASYADTPQAPPGDCHGDFKSLGKICVSTDGDRSTGEVVF
jgi:hypothetical protein